MSNVWGASGTIPEQETQSTINAAAALSDRLLADADVVLTHADVVSTHADVVSTATNAGIATVNAGIATIAADNADISEAAAAASAALAASYSTFGLGAGGSYDLGSVADATIVFPTDFGLII